MKKEATKVMMMMMGVSAMQKELCMNTKWLEHGNRNFEGQAQTSS